MFAEEKVGITQIQLEWDRKEEGGKSVKSR